MPPGMEFVGILDTICPVCLCATVFLSACVSVAKKNYLGHNF